MTYYVSSETLDPHTHSLTHEPALTPYCSTEVYMLIATPVQDAGLYSM